MDLISRQAAIDAVDGVDWYHQNQHGEMVHGANPDEHQAWYKAEDIYKAIESVPSAQPTDEEIQRIQDIEQAMLEKEKAYWFGKQDAMQWIPCSECDRMVEVYDNLDRDTMERVRKEYEKEGDTIDIGSR